MVEKHEHYEQPNGKFGGICMKKGRSKGSGLPFPDFRSKELSVSTSRFVVLAILTLVVVGLLWLASIPIVLTPEAYLHEVEIYLPMCIVAVLGIGAAVLAGYAVQRHELRRQKIKDAIQRGAWDTVPALLDPDREDFIPVMKVAVRLPDPEFSEFMWGGGIALSEDLPPGLMDEENTYLRARFAAVMGHMDEFNRLMNRLIGTSLPDANRLVKFVLTNGHADIYHVLPSYRNKFAWKHLGMSALVADVADTFKDPKSTDPSEVLFSLLARMGEYKQIFGQLPRTDPNIRLPFCNSCSTKVQVEDEFCTECGAPAVVLGDLYSKLFCPEFLKAHVQALLVLSEHAERFYSASRNPDSTFDLAMAWSESSEQSECLIVPTLWEHVMINIEMNPDPRAWIRRIEVALGNGNERLIRFMPPNLLPSLVTRYNIDHEGIASMLRPIWRGFRPYLIEPLSFGKFLNAQRYDTFLNRVRAALLSSVGQSRLLAAKILSHACRTCHKYPYIFFTQRFSTTLGSIGYEIRPNERMIDALFEPLLRDLGTETHVAPLGLLKARHSGYLSG